MDVVHVHHPFLSGRLALRYCRPLSIPVVFTNHTRYDLYAQTYLPGLPESISGALLETYLPTFCSAVDLVISPSKGMAEILRKLKVEAPISIIPNGVELHRFQKVVKPASRNQFGFQDDHIILVFVGRLDPVKNLAFLIKSFAGVAEAVPNARLLLIGGGPAEEELKNQVMKLGIWNRVHFSGRIGYEILPSYLAMCDAFVTASITEVHPLSVIEAMAAGLPVLGIHSPGVGDTIEDGVTGLLCSENLAAFTAKLTVLCIQNEERKRMGINARNASNQYAIEHITKRMISFYQNLVMESRPHQRGLIHRVRSLLENFKQ